jgi:hypothetical protein
MITSGSPLPAIAVALNIDPARITRDARGTAGGPLTIGDRILGIYPYSSTFSPAFAHS